ncbi:S-adenosyl-L-methionine-dependent methyltransferase [Pseudomassariella vexata]|uniref:S-adenosyl-L-methionine-dependent methyltransferase n=1 Tax=Pseudomassariella vexata TaxID=1141098 RepID=A0A1Y2DVN4_9PEZI|nr:S-adenosyl-L-methionine-dependent methyltransferase [Pseudomassariella vexata]ORY63352.1 S-adenosyl-L-methionine-dependent methyltransferase [Pseudomassariella vexata]
MDAQTGLAIATSPNDIAAIPNLVGDINEFVKNLENGGNEARHKLLLKARDLVQALETPRETMIKHTWAQPGAAAGLITGVDTGLWVLMARDGDKPQKVAEGRESWNIPCRLLRHLAAMGYLAETGPGEYKLTNFTKSMSLPVISGGYIALLGGIGRSSIEFHKFLRKTNWRNPIDATKTSMHLAYGTDLPNAFEYLRSIGYGPHTNNHMGGYRQGRLPWMHESIYPVAKQLFPGADSKPDAPLVVDIAGGLGHDIAEFQKMYPDHPGRLILQDLPVVIADVKDLDSNIERIGYDFHTEQPIKGARAYFMHSIMHDWPDDVCKRILSRIAEAMKPGYSKLLIFDCVIPRTGAYWENTAGDMLMMTQLSALERTQDNWYDLIEGNGLGLKIVKIWRCSDTDVENLIECELA